jgi:DNA polymerase-4
MSGAPLSAQDERDRGRDEDGCSILHVDMDAFFASVELARRPQLRGLPVIVGAGARGTVLAATYEARSFGVHPAMPMSTALRQCPQAIVVPPDHQAYHEVSSGIMQLLGDVTALVEQVSVDEAFLDVVGARRRLGQPTVIAALIRRRVREQYGITCSVGIGSTKVVARLASGLAKPDGVLLVPRRATVDFLRVLPVGALWGVGERTEQALAHRGIRTVAELADSDVTTVQRAVGRVAGAHLVDLSWGRDLRPVVPGRKERSVCVAEAFVADLASLADVADLAVVQAKARELSDRCAARLRTGGVLARTVSVRVRTSDFRALTRSRTLQTPTDVGRELYLAVRELIAGVDVSGVAVRMVEVRAEGLVAVAEVIRQPTLEEALGEPGRSGRRTEHPMNLSQGDFVGAATDARVSQVRGVPSRSTTTFVPADLS